jgi:hypothetical protein
METSMGPPGTDRTLEQTRRSLHAVAETLLAGPQHRIAGTIRLVVQSDGFSTLPLPGDPARVSVRGTDLVVTRGGGDRLLALQGSLGELADAAGLDFGAPEGVYGDTSQAGGDDPVLVDASAAATIERALALGAVALSTLGAAYRPDDPPTPVLWPEHFDVGISLGEVNFGVSPGDDGIAEPYAYVGPWKQRTGDFWNQPYGAAATIARLGDAAGVLSFFETGRERAAGDPLA